jgi:ketosteroid isomerase-like protein
MQEAVFAAAPMGEPHSEMGAILGTVSKKNVEIVARALEAAPTDPETFFAVFDQDLDWDTSSGVLPDAKTDYRGPGGVREFFRRWIGPFDDFGYELEEVIDAGDSVIVLLHQWGSGSKVGAAYPATAPEVDRAQKRRVPGHVITVTGYPLSPAGSVIHWTSWMTTPLGSVT